MKQKRTASAAPRVAHENIQAVARLQEQAARQRSPVERFGDAVSALAAREATVALHVVWFAAWVLLNLSLIHI